MIVNNITELIGNTPLVRLNKVKGDLDVDLMAKVEFFNPGGSIKDRAALRIIEKAEQEGLINQDTILVESTSGNTGVGLAMVASIKGYKMIITMPETMSVERRKLLAAYGAELVLTPGNLGMAGAIEKAKEIIGQNPNAFLCGQFDNPSNPEAHYLTTAEEIYRDTDGMVDIVVAGIGTGGTISGTGKRLKELNEHIRIIGAEPKESAVINGKDAGSHKIQGIGAGFIPKNLDLGLVDEVIEVPGDEAIAWAKRLATEEGLLVGISSGAAVFAAMAMAKRPENKGKRIVVILPDTGERYLSTELFSG